MIKEIAIGIDIGGTNTVFAFVDRDGNIFEKGQTPTGTYTDPEKYVKHVCDRIKLSEKNIDFEYRIVGIGIGAPNGNYYSGAVEFAPNLAWKGVVKLTDLFHDNYDNLPVFLTNDANAAAIGEMIFGGARAMKDFVVITLGTGVGSGIVVNGNVVYGHDGFAGEVGHTIFDPQGRDCGCGRKGCLETYLNSKGIVKTYKELATADAGIASKFSDEETEISPRIVYERALTGDKTAIETWDVSGRILGIKLADLVAHTSPEAIFIFGGIANAGDFLFDPVKKYLEQYLLNIYKGKVKVMPSELPEGDSAVLGASALLWNELQ